MFNNTFMLDRLSKQKEEIENMIRNYQNPQQPVNNFINTTQTPPKDLIEWRILNEDEEMRNKYMMVANSLFDMYVKENNNIMNKYRES